MKGFELDKRFYDFDQVVEFACDLAGNGEKVRITTTEDMWIVS